MAYSNDTEKLAEVKAAISQAMKAKKWQHGDDSAESADLALLQAEEKRLETKLSTRRRGPRGVGIRICH
tara:strand:+ start:582 stop:788 length:207 start_codon:yes stop_codon:yes gene_type:complete